MVTIILLSSKSCRFYLKIIKNIALIIASVFPLDSLIKLYLISLEMKDMIATNLRKLHGRIAEACDKYNRDANDITIVAVSKRHPAAVMKIAAAAGILDIGESRIQEAEPKLTEVGNIARFHMIGHLQTNKVKKAVALFDIIQSVDSLHLAEEINREAKRSAKIIDCFIQVNISGEESKYGVKPEQVLSLIKSITELHSIRLVGIMSLGPLTDDESIIRSAFSKCRDIFKASQDMTGENLDHLSMGMSDDFPLAIAEGSTMIRIGSGLFGPRLE